MINSSEAHKNLGLICISQLYPTEKSLFGGLIPIDTHGIYTFDDIPIVIPPLDPIWSHHVCWLNPHVQTLYVVRLYVYTGCLEKWISIKGL